MYFSIDDFLSVFVNMIMEGTNATSFIHDEHILKKIIAERTNSSSSEVAILINHKKSWMKNNDCPVNLTCVSINVEMIPRDRSHEIHIITEMFRTEIVRDEINLMLQNQTTSKHLNVRWLSQMYQAPSNRKQSYFSTFSGSSLQ